MEKNNKSGLSSVVYRNKVQVKYGYIKHKNKIKTQQFIQKNHQNKHFQITYLKSL